MGEDAQEGTGKQQPLHPHGILNAARVGCFLPERIGPGQTDFSQAIRTIAGRLNRPAYFVDNEGYEQAILAGALGSDGAALAWVESRSKELENHYVDVEFRLKAHIGNRLAIDWEVESYNPYFGCRVGYMSWNGRRVVVIYREKHHTYACALGEQEAVKRVQISDHWMVTQNQIVYISEKKETVERLSLPDLARWEDMDREQAHTAGLLLPAFDEVMERRRRWAAEQADPAYQARFRAKVEKIRRRMEQEGNAR